MKHLILLIFMTTTGCATLFSGHPSTPAQTAASFAGFPNHFTALQAVSVALKAEEKTVIASLRRDDRDFHVTFLDAAFQTPLLELKTFGPEDQRTRYFVDKARLPFDPKMILASIVALYEAKEFRTVSAPDEDPVLAVRTDDAEYLLADLKSYDGCAFPARIQLRFNATQDETVPQVLPRLRIETKDLECK